MLPCACSPLTPWFGCPHRQLYDNLQKYNLPYAEAVFDIDYFRVNPAPFYHLCREMWPGQSLRGQRGNGFPLTLG